MHEFIACVLSWEPAYKSLEMLKQIMTEPNFMSRAINMSFFKKIKQ